MESTKLRIDLSQGVIEAEGNEGFVLTIYNDFKGMLKTSSGMPQIGSLASRAAAISTEIPERKTAKRTSGKAKPLSLLKDLDLSSKGDIPSLRDFYAKYEVKSNFERNLIFIYYLEHIRKVSPITLDHVFTCYRHIPNVKVPVALQQSLWDTSSKHGWLDTSSSDNIKVAVAGINDFEHDLKMA